MRRGRGHRTRARAGGSRVLSEGVGFAMSPKSARARPHGGQRVGEGRTRFGVPRGGRDASPLASWKARSQQGDDREQGEQALGGAGNRHVGPLPLGLDAEMGAHLLEGDLDAPAADEPRHDLGWVTGEVGAEQGLGLEAVLGIAHKHPADWHDRHPAVPPHRGVRRDLDRAHARPVLAWHHERMPARVPGREDRGECRQACAFGAWAPDCTGRLGRSGFVEGRVEP